MVTVGCWGLQGGAPGPNQGQRAPDEPPVPWGAAPRWGGHSGGGRSRELHPGQRVGEQPVLLFASPHFSPLLVFLIFLSSSPLLGLLLLSSSSLLGCHLLLSSSSLLGCLLLLFSSHLLVLLGHLLFSSFSLLSTSEMTRGHAACCHNLYFRAGGCHFFLSSPRPAAALSIASIDVPNVGQGYAWSPLPRPPRLPPLRPRMSPQASKDQQS